MNRTDESSSPLFARIPAETRRRLDETANRLGTSKREVIARLVDRYADPSDPDALARLAGPSRRRVVVEDRDAALTVGRAEIRPTAPAEVLTLEQAAALLLVEPQTLARLAAAGEVPARALDGEWRFARAALMAWLGATDGPE